MTIIVLTTTIIVLTLLPNHQILRAHNLQDTRESNPKAYDIRIRYHKMYYHFKPSKAYWIILITLRKVRQENR